PSLSSRYAGDELLVGTLLPLAQTPTNSPLPLLNLLPTPHPQAVRPPVSTHQSSPRHLVSVQQHICRRRRATLKPQSLGGHHGHVIRGHHHYPASKYVGCQCRHHCGGVPKPLGLEVQFLPLRGHGRGGIEGPEGVR
uniref:Uncharacterized protein n=1 Tax=Aegilops tauschii subsp. strangulata TaxID=200361 RepID=A0A453BYS5_AEGTS